MSVKDYDESELVKLQANRAEFKLDALHKTLANRYKFQVEYAADLGPVALHIVDHSSDKAIYTTMAEGHTLELKMDLGDEFGES